MTVPILFALVGAAGYLAGATPFGYLTARLIAGIDIRRAGSGNIGATNIGRVLGAKWGIVVLVLDCLKGLLPVLLVPLLMPETAESASQHLQVLCGLSTITGHMFPVWLNFRGGKGVATALGVVLAIGGWATLAAFAAFAITFVLFRIVSLSSISAAVTFAAVQMVLLQPGPFSNETWSAGLFSLLVPALILWRHRGNIGRLLRGEEQRFRFGAGKSPTSGDASASKPDNQPADPDSGGNRVDSARRQSFPENSPEAADGG